MGRKMKKWLSIILAAVVALTGIPTAGMGVQAAESAAATQEYEIYPTPHEIVYGDRAVTLNDTANVVIEDGIDEATINRLDDILEIKNITGNGTDGIVSGTTNILVGIKGSGGTVDNWFSNNVIYEASLFDKVDSYVLVIWQDVIAVLGKDTDAAFYGLSSLKMIMNQAEGMDIRELQMNDYADGQYRGFIEGYYGIPWSVDDRISLMNFGGDFKMNIYIFAPKDDEYHNSKWRELYPDEKLEDIRRMVEAGAAAKCRFAWAIHPFMNDGITSSNYSEGLQAIKNKFKQLYDVGVRQFVISADDIYGTSTYQLQANLIRDMSAWVKEQPGTYNLVFVPQVYCGIYQNWGYNLTSYYNYFKGSDYDDVEIMWTGDVVCSPATQSTFNTFKSYSGKDPFMWLNWPVNDVNHKRLVMGPAESCILNTNVTSFKGIVTNPLEQAEASKTSLFAIADYAWNVAGFSCYTSWEDSFKYIDEGAPEALHELCKHMTNPSPGGITAMGESTELAPYITAFENAYNSGNGTNFEESGNALIEQLEKIVAAADEFQANGTNVNLLDEMKPWVDSLRYLSKACIGYVKTAIAIQQDDAEAVCGNYLSAVNNYRASQKCESLLLNGTQMVEAGAMEIMPFAAAMDEAVEEAALAVLDNSFGTGESTGGSEGGTTAAGQTLIYSGIGENYSQDYSSSISNITDGNDSTYAWFNKAIEKDAYIGLDLGVVYKLDNIRILQGNSATHGDIFATGILEYSIDNYSWTTIGEFSENNIEINVLEQNLKARYVRLRTPSALDNWYAIRAFEVTTQEVKDFLYTNIESMAEQEVTINKNDASIPAISAITLNSGEYVGLSFVTAREITALTADYTQKDLLSLEYSYNSYDWYPVEENFEAIDAKYVRIVNKGNEAVTFDLNGLSLQNTDVNRTIFVVPEGIEGNEAVKVVDNSILTAFKASEGSGSLTWRIDAGLQDSLYILQDAENISDAKVWIRTNGGNWVQVGNLSQSRNVIDNLLMYGPVNEVKITWEENGPTIYEMYTKNSEYTDRELLTKVVDYAKAVEEEKYEETSVAALKEAVSEAEAVIENSNASEEEIMVVLDKVYAAAGSLTRKIETEEEQQIAQLKEQLGQAVTDAGALKAAGGDKYTEDSWKAFTEAYKAASEAEATAGLAELQKLLEALKNAQANLKEKEQNTKPSETEPAPETEAPQQTGIKNGDVVTVKKLKYRVINAAKKQAAVYGVTDKNLKSVKVAATVKINGETCKVTEISAKTFANMKKLQKVTVGKNVTTIKKKAFFNDKKLKNIVVKSSVLKKVAKDILKKANTKCTIKVPKKMKKPYAKLFKSGKVK